MKMKIPVIGGVCQSTQGRDKDRYYLIREIYSNGMVGVVDGSFKKLASPKRKNVKHLRLLPETAQVIAQKFIEGKQVFDTEIYSALKPFNNPQAENIKDTQS